jgi:DNA polymerase-1
MKTLFFDIETNAIEDWSNLSDLHTVHCLSIYDPTTPKMITYHGAGIQNGLQELAKADRIVGHNVIGFDLPALSKMYSFHPPLIKVLDTMVMAKCIVADVRNDDFLRKNYDKSLIGSHSLKAWGLRLSKLTKLSYGEEDGAFDSYNDEMRKYCERDTIVTQILFDYLMQQNPSGEMLAIEHWFAFLMRLQEKKGFAFDIEKAEKLELKLASKRAELLDRLQKEFPAKTEEMKSPAGWSLQVECTDGIEVLTATTKVELKGMLKTRNLKQTLVKDAVKLGNKTKTILFNPGSRHEIKQRFEELGIEIPVQPDGKTIKMDGATLERINHPFASLLLEYLTVQKRLGQLAEGNVAWLKLMKDGRIHGRVNTNGAVTGRCTHSFPNLAQVPAVDMDYGEECRDLFKAGDGYKLVGCDASGLELRMLAHYLAFYDGGDYAKEVIEGDIHTRNQKAAGLAERSQAKTFIYALLYGAGDQLIGEIVGGGAREGQQLKRRFYSNIPALAKLQAAIERKVQNGGKLIGLDGRILPVRSQHKALNMLLQSAGAVTMKVALIQLFQQLNHLKWQHGREYSFVANVHDEFQAEVKPDKASVFCELAVESIRRAGKELKLNVMLDGEAKVGMSWKETH